MIIDKRLLNARRLLSEYFREVRYSKSHEYLIMLDEIVNDVYNGVSDEPVYVEGNPPGD